MTPDDLAVRRRRNAQAAARWKVRNQEAYLRYQRLRNACRRLTRASLRLRGELGDQRPADRREGDR